MSDDMNCLPQLRNLAVMVHAVCQNVEIEGARLSALMSSNDARLSKYHSRFAELLRQYAAFAGAYKHDMHTLYQSLLHEVDTQQRKAEEDRVERLVQEKLEIMSNKSNKSNNLEITENVQDAEYSPATSTANEAKPDIDDTPHHHAKMSYVSIDDVPPPQDIKSRDSVPSKHATSKAATTRVPAPKSQTKLTKQTNVSKQNHHKNKNQPKNKSKSKKQKKQSKQVIAGKPAETPLATEASAAGAASVEPEQKSVALSEHEVDEQRYVYDAKRVHANRWSFVEPVRSSTLVHISNIPGNIKVAAVQFFVMKRAKVSMRQIEETQLKQGARGSQYALVRFRSDVALHKVVAFMNSINNENAQIAEQRKQNDGELEVVALKKSKDGNNKKATTKKAAKQTKTSWQTRVFVRFNDNRRWYESEEEMYGDRAAKNKLFIRNFDMVDAQCHEEMTNILLEFGDIYQDIEMGTDSFSDPYCIVWFKSLEDAIFCRNSSIEFNGRWLEIEYLNAGTMQRLFC